MLYLLNNMMIPLTHILVKCMVGLIIIMMKNVWIGMNMKKYIWNLSKNDMYSTQYYHCNNDIKRFCEIQNRINELHGILTKKHHQFYNGWYSFEELVMLEEEFLIIIKKLKWKIFFYLFTKKLWFQLQLDFL